MKKILLLLSIALNCFFAKAQTWSSVGSGLNESVYAECVYNGNLIAAGYFTKAGSVAVNSIAMWNGSSWSPLGQGIGGNSYPVVYALCVYKGILYAGGSFATAGGKPVNNIAAWNGTSWSAVGSGVNEDGIWSLTVFNNLLIAGGIFDSAGGNSANNIASWNGSAWAALGSGFNNLVRAVCGYDSVLYAAGDFTNSGSTVLNSVAQWNGSAWTAMGAGIDPYITSITAGSAGIFFGGYFNTAGGMPINGIAQWNGKGWSGLGKGIDHYEVFALYENNGVLYVGGDFDSAGSINSEDMAIWTGSNWDSAGFGKVFYNTADTGVYALVNYNGSIYAGGIFRIVDNDSIYNITVLNSTVGISGVNTKQSNVAVYPNPSSGIFNFVVNNRQLMANSSIEVYNMLGEIIATTYSVPLGGQGWSLDLRDYPPAIYFYRILDKTGTLIGSGKLLKE